MSESRPSTSLPLVPKPSQSGVSIGHIFHEYTQRLRAIAHVVTPLRLVGRTLMRREASKFLNFMVNHCGFNPFTIEENKTFNFSIPSEMLSTFKRHILTTERMAHAAGVVPETIIMSFIGQYDAFLGRLLRCIYMAKPDLLNSSEKTMTYSELLGLPDYESIRHHIIEKEVESVLRKSHSDHFSWMESKFHIKLREGLETWPVFVELTERRNLFAHCDGVVSNQYRSVCSKSGVPIPDLPSLNEKLGADEVYITKAHNCLFDIGCKLAHVLWRQQLPQDRQAADEALNMTIYELLDEEQYALAQAIGAFALTTFKGKFSSDEIRTYILINLAQAYKWGNKADMCKSLIGKEDWSSKSSVLKMAAAILVDNFDDAATHMKRLGTDGPPKEYEYSEWPLFRNFRKTKQFADAYYSLFGRTFQPTQRIPADTIRSFHDLKLLINSDDLLHAPLHDWCI